MTQDGEDMAPWRGILGKLEVREVLNQSYSKILFISVIHSTAGEFP